MEYKDFPKHDLRRVLAVLFAVERMGGGASLHYLSLDLNCTRAEVSRAIVAAQRQLMVEVEKHGAVYRIKSWGLLNKDAVRCAMGTKENPSLRSGSASRESEALLVRQLVSATTEQRPPRSPREADLFRFAAQLLKTRHTDMATFLNAASSAYFSKTKVRPRSFEAVTKEGLVGDVSRLRNLMEKELSGVSSW